MKFLRITSIILVFAFFISNSVGIIIVYNQIKFYHKKAIKEQIKQNNFNEVVEILSFSKVDLQNKKVKLNFIEEHEFRFNNKLYDIISIWETADSIYYKCINDTKEEELEKVFVSYVVNNGKRQDLPFHVRQLLSILQLDAFNLLENSFLKIQNLIAFLHYFNFTLVETYLVIPEPPPR